MARGIPNGPTQSKGAPSSSSSFQITSIKPSQAALLALRLGVSGLAGWASEPTIPSCYLASASVLELLRTMSVADESSSVMPYPSALLKANCGPWMMRRAANNQPDFLTVEDKLADWNV